MAYGVFIESYPEKLMIEFSNLSHLEVRKRILEKMSINNDNVIDGELRHQIESDDYLEDVCKIGALLSDQRMCMAFSGRLNDSLIEYAKKTGVLKKMTTRSDPMALKRSPGFGRKEYKLELVDDPDFDLTVEKHKHYKVLSGFLTEFEAGHKFNEGEDRFTSQDKTGANVELLAREGRAVTLPGFAPPDVFRASLLAKARHFKDPTVGALHGEFTHRIQWYIVCEYVRLMKHINKSPADIFKACARPIFVGAKTTIWDMVFEGSFGANDFRKPEALTEFMLRVSAPNHAQHKSLWFLAELTAGRYAKRKLD